MAVYTVADAVPQKLIHLLNVLEVLAILTAVARRDPAALPPGIASLVNALPLPTRFSNALARVGAGISKPSSFTAGFLSQVAGTVLRYAAIRWLGRYFTFQLAVRDGHRLVTDGPYSMMRHPSYTGSHLFMIGAAIAQMGSGSFYSQWKTIGPYSAAAAPWCALWYYFNLAYTYLGGVMRAPKEDEVLRKEFGEEWEEWAKRTPYRLYPFVY